MVRPRRGQALAAIEKDADYRSYREAPRCFPARQFSYNPSRIRTDAWPDNGAGRLLFLVVRFFP
jgi:hypothetical protein